MGDLVLILVGSGAVFIGLTIIINVMLLLINDLRGKERLRLSRTWHIIIGVVSIILYSLYELYEAKKIFEPQSLDKITYIGPLSIVFSGMYAFVAGLFIAFFACAIIMVILKKEISRYEKKVHLICFSVAVLSLFCYFAGSKNIDSYFARDKFITTYTVNAFPENVEGKNYRLKADIRVNNGSMFSLRDKEIYILKVYFINGGYLIPQEQESDEFKETRKMKIQDQYGKWWDIEVPQQF